LDNHLGVGDKTLAEFIIALGKDQTSATAFQKALAENGAEMPLPLVSEEPRRPVTNPSSVAWLCDSTESESAAVREMAGCRQHRGFNLSHPCIHARSHRAATTFTHCSSCALGFSRR